MNNDLSRLQFFRFYFKHEESDAKPDKHIIGSNTLKSWIIEAWKIFTVDLLIFELLCNWLTMHTNTKYLSIYAVT